MPTTGVTPGWPEVLTHLLGDDHVVLPHSGSGGPANQEVDPATIEPREPVSGSRL